VPEIQHSHDHDEHREGLEHDLAGIVRSGHHGRTMARRGVLGLFGGLGAAALVACGTDSSGTASGTASSSATESAAGAGGMGGPGGGGAPPADTGSGVEVAEGEIPEETAGPYPGDGSNGVNVLTESGIVRSDITTSFGSASGVAEGVPLRIDLKLYDLTGTEVTPLAGAAIYLWHCDRDGNYSLYSDGITDENYLRGVQETASDGSVSFTSIFPATYSGRWPHIHFEVYPSLDEATNASNKMRTTQLAIPEEVAMAVYEGAEGYEQSITNIAQVSLESDNVFSDGYSLQMATMSGSVAEGYTATLNVPV